MAAVSRGRLRPPMAVGALVATLFVGCVADPDTGPGPEETGAGDETTTTTQVEPAGDPAADFTLALGEGGSFTLSEEPRSVFLLFWAEWCPVCSRYVPVVDTVAGDYLDEVAFVAVAGRSSLDASRARVGEWFSPDRLMWGYDDDLWGTYLVAGQPMSVLVSGDGVVVDRWFGAVGELVLRERLDALLAFGR